jgi:hypothetical protein
MIRSPCGRCHSFQVLSSLAVARMGLLGCSATLATGSRWPCSHKNVKSSRQAVSAMTADRAVLCTASTYCSMQPAGYVDLMYTCVHCLSPIKLTLKLFWQVKLLTCAGRNSWSSHGFRLLPAGQGAPGPALPCRVADTCLLFRVLVPVLPPTCCCVCCNCCTCCGCCWC